MNPLSKRFDAEEKAYKRLLKLAESKVVRWEYWDGFHWHWDPVEVKNWQVHYCITKQTAKDKAVYAYGYDSNNRIIVIRDGLPGEELPQLSEEFIRYAKNMLTSSKFFTGQLLEISSATISNGRTVRVENIGSGSDWWTIEWRGNEVARILFGLFGKKPSLEWCYDKSGKRTGMYDLPRKLRLPKGVTFDSLTKTIYMRLMQLVPKAVSKAGIKQPVYCLVLAYDGEGNGVLPPTLGVGLESERQNWMKNDLKDSKLLIWNPAEFRNYETKRTSLPLDKKFEKACEWYNQLLERKETNTPARTLLNKVASDLGMLDWNGKLNTTDDFVVFAVDYEGSDLVKNLKKSVPAKTFARLKAAKMI